MIAGRWVEGVRPGSLSGPREAAVWVVEKSLARGGNADRLRRRVEAGLESRDRALLHQLITLTLRWLMRLDDVLVQVGGKPIHRIDPRLLGPLRLGAAQLLFLDRIPPHAAVDESVRMARRHSRPGSGFVNALLRKIARRPDVEAYPARGVSWIERLAVETSHPVMLVERWIERLGEAETRQMLAANNRDRRASLLVVSGEDGLEGSIASLAAAGVSASRSVLSPVGLQFEDGGDFEIEDLGRLGLYPQDEASQCSALIPLPRPGERILDAAAAPGGKTLALLAWESRLEVTAADNSLGRLRRLLGNRARFGASFRVAAMDGRCPGLAPRAFDRVLADLPCTGTGTLRKHPELKWRVTAGELARLVREGGRILDGLAPLVRPGGLLVISTCSVEAEENEAQVASFLSRHQDFSPENLEDGIHRHMADQLRAPGCWRLLPGNNHDGFTVHALRRGA